MRKILSKIHLYLSIPVGLVISVTCLTGSMMVFDGDIHELFNGDLYGVHEVSEVAMPMDQLVDKLLTQLPEGQEIKGVKVFGDNAATYQFSVEGEGRTAFYVNQYTGELLGSRDSFKEGGFYRTMFYMHRWLMNYNRDFSWGKQIVGASTMLMVIILLTGFFIWLPRGMRFRKRCFSICVTRGWRRFWYDLHVAGGMYITGGVLILGLTGLLWSYPSWYRPMAYAIFNIEVPEKTERRHNRDKQEKSVIKYDRWSDAMAKIQEENSEALSISMSDGRAYVYNNRYGNVRAYDTYNFNRETGEIESIDPYHSRAETSRFMGWAYSIHVGTWGGMFGKTLTFIVSLFGGILPITGYYLWFKRVYRNRGSVDKKRL